MKGQTFISYDKENFSNSRKILLGTIIDTINSIKTLHIINDEGKKRKNEITQVNDEIEKTLKLIKKLDEILPHVKARAEKIKNEKKENMQLSAEDIEKRKHSREKRKEAKKEKFSRLDAELLEIRKKVSDLS